MLIKTLIKQKKIIGFPIPPQWKNDTVDTIKTNIKNIPLYHIIEEPFVSLSADGKIAV